MSCIQRHFHTGSGTLVKEARKHLYIPERCSLRTVKTENIIVFKTENSLYIQKPLLSLTNGSQKPQFCSIFPASQIKMYLQGA